MEDIYEIFSQSQPFTTVIYVNRISNWNQLSSSKTTHTAIKKNNNTPNAQDL